MEHEFKQIMSQRTDKQLIKIITTDREKYQPSAVDAAELEIESRNIDAVNEQADIEHETIETHKISEVENQTVSATLRFANYIIDTIIFYFLTVLVLITTSALLPANNEPLMQIITIALLIMILFLYYFIMESKYQKSVGKFITKTKVVTLNGEKPNNATIATRTLCRLIPFDNFSFLFMANGFHDNLSKTKVVNDTE